MEINGTAFLAAEIVHGQEGYHIDADQDEIVEFMQFHTENF